MCDVVPTALVVGFRLPTGSDWCLFADGRVGNRECSAWGPSTFAPSVTVLIPVGAIPQFRAKPQLKDGFLRRRKPTGSRQC